MRGEFYENAFIRKQTSVLMSVAFMLFLVPPAAVHGTSVVIDRKADVVFVIDKTGSMILNTN